MMTMTTFNISDMDVMSLLFNESEHVTQFYVT